MKRFLRSGPLGASGASTRGPAHEQKVRYQLPADISRATVHIRCFPGTPHPGYRLPDRKVQVGVRRRTVRLVSSTAIQRYLHRALCDLACLIPGDPSFLNQRSRNLFRQSDKSGTEIVPDRDPTLDGLTELGHMLEQSPA